MSSTSGNDPGRRLRAVFAQGVKVAKEGNFDYATEMFRHCVAADPGETIYLKSFLANLARKYENNKRGAGGTAQLVVHPERERVQVELAAKSWACVWRPALAVLAWNPWERGMLFALATACVHQGFEASELVLLRMVLDAEPQDVEAHRRAAEALRRQGE